MGRLAGICGVLGLVGSFGCSASRPESTVSGTLALDAFPTKPTSVLVTDERGVARRAPVAADGSFAVTVPKGHRYSLTIEGVPVVFPRRSGRIDPSFAVQTRGAAIRIGTVRYLAEPPTSGFHVTSGGTGDGDIDDDESSTCNDHDDGQQNDVAVDDPGSGNHTSAIAVGQLNVPSTVDGCDDEDDDDDDEQEGEH